MCTFKAVPEDLSEMEDVLTQTVGLCFTQI